MYECFTWTSRRCVLRFYICYPRCAHSTPITLAVSRSRSATFRFFVCVASSYDSCVRRVFFPFIRLNCACFFCGLRLCAGFDVDVLVANEKHEPKRRMNVKCTHEVPPPLPTTGNPSRVHIHVSVPFSCGCVRVHVLVCVHFDHSRCGICCLSYTYDRQMDDDALVWWDNRMPHKQRWCWCVCVCDGVVVLVWPDVFVRKTQIHLRVSGRRCVCFGADNHDTNTV